jgi:hypothetical protein
MKIVLCMKPGFKEHLIEKNLLRTNIDIIKICMPNVVTRWLALLLHIQEVGERRVYNC